jgi:hypothetical protein
MYADYLSKVLIGAAGMAIGASLVTAVRVAAVDGVERARVRHLAEVASGKVPMPRVVARGGLECPHVVEAD